jgi:hypothetical protein
VSSERLVVLETIRAYRDTVVDVCAGDPEMALRVHADDPAALDELLDLACRRTGLARAFYESALFEDPALLDLQRLSLREVIESPPDPGPYSQISRESPAGTPANWHVHPWNGITPPGGVGGSGPPGDRPDAPRRATRPAPAGHVPGTCPAPRPQWGALLPPCLSRKPVPPGSLPGAARCAAWCLAPARNLHGWALQKASAGPRGW